jgi:o-succinylbenzoate synthase
MTAHKTLHISPLHFVLRAPLATARGDVASRKGWLVKVKAPDGLEGLGEATPLPDAGTEAPDVCLAALEAATAREFPLPQHIWDVDGWLNAMGVRLKTPAARFALETAALDVLARRARVPLARLLDPNARNSTAVNALVSSAEEAQRAAGEGYATLKLKVGMDDTADLHRTEAVARAVGRDVTLRLDANGGWDLTRAVGFLTRVSGLPVEHCEDPLPRPTDVDALRAQVHTPIAADAWLTDVMVAEDLVRNHRVDVLVLKPAVLGGLIPALALAQRAVSLGVRCVVTSTLDGTVARLAAAHLACALPGEPRAAGLSTGRLFSSETIPDPVPPHHGVITLPDTPGLGMTA